MKRMQVIFSIVVPIIILVNSILNIQAQEGWFMQNPKPLWQSFTAIYPINENEVIAVGNGKIVKTNDAGENWNIVFNDSDNTQNFRQVHFGSDDVGWALGKRTILKTMDGGVNWNLLVELPEWPIDIFLMNEDTGFVSGRFGEKAIILRTINGGSTWDTVCYEGSGSFNSIYFVNENIGYAAGKVGYSGRVFKTIDGGDSWIGCNYHCLSEFLDLNFSDADTGYVTTLHMVYKTTNGGDSWEMISNFLPYYNASIKFINSSIGCVTGSVGWWGKGVILKTIDGGVSWDSLLFDNIGSIRSVYFRDANTGWFAGGDGAIYRSEDSGENWEKISGSIILSHLNAVQFLDTLNGYIVGNGGTILKTDDGGINWQILLKDRLYLYRDLCFIDQDTGWVVGNVTLKTTDGGDTWDTINIVHEDFYSIHFLDSDNGIISAKNKIYRTNDGGLQWEQVLLHHDTIDWAIGPARNMFFIGNTGWISCTKSSWQYGTGDAVFKSEDGGYSWNKIFTIGPMFNGAYAIHDLFFLTEYIGWMALLEATNTGYYYYILKTFDGGLSWYESANIIYEQEINSVYFTDENNGWVIGDQWMYSSDGGIYWESDTSSVPKWGGNDLFFADENNGWVVGNWGRIWKTTTGGLITNIEDSSFPDYEVLENGLHIFPNPFTSSTTIEYELIHPQTVTITFYNQFGKQVDMIEEYQQKGLNRVVWIPENLADGVYYFKLEADQHIANGKLLKIN